MRSVILDMSFGPFDRKAISKIPKIQICVVDHNLPGRITANPGSHPPLFLSLAYSHNPAARYDQIFIFMTKPSAHLINGKRQSPMPPRC